MPEDGNWKKDYYLLRPKEAQKLEIRNPRLQRLKLRQSDYIEGTLTYLFYAQPNDLAHFYVAEYGGLPCTGRVTCKLLQNFEALKQSFGSKVVHIDTLFMFYDIIVERVANMEEKSADVYLETLWRKGLGLMTEKEWMYYFLEDSRWVFHLTQYGSAPLLFEGELNETALMINKGALEARRLASMSKYV